MKQKSRTSVLEPALAGKLAPGRDDERFRLLVESVRECAIFLLDERGIVESWNEGAALIHGYSSQDAIGQNYSRFFLPAEAQAGKPRQLLEAAAAQGRCQDESWRLRQDGSRFLARVVVTPLRDRRGQLSGFSHVARDLTDRQRNEDQARHLNAELAQKAAQLEAAHREMEAFSYAVSHDLRAPLRHIDSFVGLVQERLGDKVEAETAEYLRIIADSARDMGKLIDAVLAFYRMGRAATRQGRVAMDALAREVLRDLHYETEGRQIEWMITNLPEVTGDASLLRQVWLNLLSNALKFTRPRPAARIELGASRSEWETIFFVRDNGVGFEMEFAGKLFCLFQRLHALSDFEGRGVGLAHVRRIIQRHGGRTWAEGVPDQGATFYFSLPRAAES